MMRSILLIVLSVTSAVSFADWKLNAKASSLNFISIKNLDFAENHQLPGLSGALTGSGLFELSIDLSSIESNIPIRNDRMKEHLFEVKKFPAARVSGEFTDSCPENIPLGESRVLDMPFTLSLHGIEKKLQAKIRITRSTKDQLEVHSLQPVLVSATVFGLDSGIAKLQELAGLSSIGKGIPVYFSLSFQR